MEWLTDDLSSSVIWRLTHKYTEKESPIFSEIKCSSAIKNSSFRDAHYDLIDATYTLPAVNLAPPELLYIISYMLNKTSRSTDKLYIFLKQKY
jgi:uncharacterized membrane-anchored protein YjiN (DUF445 family)